MVETHDPLATLMDWREEARGAGVKEPDAMVLATATPSGVPSARVVFFRGFSATGAVRFFTNYESRKGRELDANPRAALVFHWAPIERQVRIEGPVTRLPPVESDAYFGARARLSQLGAWVSPQSRPIASLAELVAKRAERERELAGVDVPRPPFWGGYGLRAERVELWRSGEGRFHERRVFERSGEIWAMSRIGP